MLLAVRVEANRFPVRKYNSVPAGNNFGVPATSLLCSPVLMSTTGDSRHGAKKRMKGNNQRDGGIGDRSSNPKSVS